MSHAKTQKKQLVDILHCKKILRAVNAVTYSVPLSQSVDVVFDFDTLMTIILVQLRNRKFSMHQLLTHSIVFLQQPHGF
jgi:hypothetical protein